MTSFTTAHRRRLQDALLDAFPTLNDLSRLAQNQLDVSLPAIVATEGRNLTEITEDLINWSCRTSDGVLNLLNAAVETRQDDANLLHILRDWQAIDFNYIPACPYLGMQPYTEKDSIRYFGRKREIDAFMYLLRRSDSRFVAIIGPSGSGKSSLVHAGCIPQLHKTPSLAQADWNVLSMRPGAMPQTTLAQELEHAGYRQSTQNDGNTLIVVDQYEEIFTQANAEDATAFQAQLEELATWPFTYVILTVRADFFPNLMESALWPMIKNNRLEVLPLQGDDLRDAIVRPAQDVGVEIEEALVVALLKDAKDEPGVLPFVQETLVMLWDKINSGILHHQAYLDLVNSYDPHSTEQLGGIQIAMAQRAEAIYQGLAFEEKGVARQIFLSLIQFGEGRTDIRRQQSATKLALVTSDVVHFDNTLAKLTQARLLTMSGTIKSEEGLVDNALVDIAHESLIQGWPRLLRWSKEYRQDEEFRRQIVAAFDQWDGSPESIAHTKNTHDMVSWATEHFDALHTDVFEFLTAVSIVEGSERLCAWLKALPIEMRQVQIKKILYFVFTEGHNGSEIVRQTIVDAAKQSCLSQEVVHDFKAILWTEFTDNDRSKPIIASMLWAFRTSLAPREHLKTIPYAFLFWSRQHRSAIAVAFFVLFSTSLVWAGAQWSNQQMLGVWQQEPSVYAGHISAATLTGSEPEELFLITQRGIGREDGAALFGRSIMSDTWSIVANDLTPRVVPQLITVSNQGQLRFFASVVGRGILRSDDGHTWQVVNEGLRSYAITALVADPDDSQVIFAGSGDKRGLFLSENGGDSWSDITPEELVGTSITEMIFTRAHDGLLLVGTEHGQILSYDRLEGWIPRVIYPGMGTISAFAVEPIFGQTIYAGTSSGSLTRSVDGGLVWEYPRQFPTIFLIQSLAVVPDEPEHLFMSAFGVGGFVVWESTDGGDNWLPIGDNAFTRETVSLLIPRSSPNTIYAYGIAGVFESNDLGRSWRHQNLGAPLATINHIVVNPQRRDSLFLTYGGSFFTRDPKSVGQWLRSNTLPLLTITDVLPHPTEQGVVYATGFVPNEWSIFRSNDGGRIWSSTGHVLGQDVKLFNHTGSLALATDGSREILFVGTDGCGVIWSDDGGQSWQTESDGQCVLPDGSPRSNIRDVDPVSGSLDKVFVAADQTRVYRTEDRGQSWTYSELPITDELVQLEIDPIELHTLYAVAGAGGLWRSIDDGTTWEDVTGPLIDDYIVGIVVVPRKSGTLFAMTRKNTLWKTMDAGRSWRQMSVNSEMGSPVSLAYDANSNSVLVGTVNSGLYRFRQWPVRQYIPINPDGGNEHD